MANQVQQLAASSACTHLVTIKHVQQLRAAGGAPRLHGGARRAGWAGLEAAAHFLMPQQPPKTCQVPHGSTHTPLPQIYTRFTVSSTHLEASGGQALAGGQRPHVPLVLHRHRAPPRLHRLQARTVATRQLHAMMHTCRTVAHPEAWQPGVACSGWSNNPRTSIQPTLPRHCTHLVRCAAALMLLPPRLQRLLQQLLQQPAALAHGVPPAA